MPSARPRRFVFVSTCPEAWGGSEELWSGAAAALACGGHSVDAFRTELKADHPRNQALAAHGVRLHPVKSKALGYVYRVIPRRWGRHLREPEDVLFSRFLQRCKPDLVVVSQGGNFDGLQFAGIALRYGFPIVMIAQKAWEGYWPPDNIRGWMGQVHDRAIRCYFVSEHNRRLTELQIGHQLANAKVVRNPFMVPVSGPIPWPADDGVVRMACPARMYTLEKGQDVLLMALAEPKWRDRPVEVSFYGQGVHSDGVKGLADTLGLRSAKFPGFVSDIAGIWRLNELLVLPSRCEGLPLTLVEAMLCGRPAVVTDVGGNAEALVDGETGFLARGPDPTSLDEALERAWLRRRDWPAMGAAAAERAVGMFPADPCGDLASELEGLTCR